MQLGTTGECLRDSLNLLGVVGVPLPARFAGSKGGIHMIRRIQVFNAVVLTRKAGDFEEERQESERRPGHTSTMASRASKFSSQEYA